MPKLWDSALKATYKHLQINIHETQFYCCKKGGVLWSIRRGSKARPDLHRAIPVL